ncbi:hypothetical protein PUN28_000357 [Cardiocondyla obscurior]|uniref:Uncharacterized protein n=1 Tax=Cardiocondyla obscurior TaxID=286306 RepID=A0AAW2GZG1_9HYME
MPFKVVFAKTGLRSAANVTSPAAESEVRVRAVSPLPHPCSSSSLFLGYPVCRFCMRNAASRDRAPACNGRICSAGQI